MPTQWMIQGESGPIEAPRPTDEQLTMLATLDEPNSKVNYAYSLAAKGLTVDAQVDVWEANYYKTMAQRRKYGYDWVPAVGMSNVITPPGEGGQEPAPVGAILIPPVGGWS
jgi:trans-aconitate methyltransferase